MATEVIQKTPFEIVDVDFDFTDRKPLSATSISSAECEVSKYLATNPDSRTDDTSTFLVSSTASIHDTYFARVVARSGDDGYAYDIICQAIWDNGRQTEHMGTVRVVDNP